MNAQDLLVQLRKLGKPNNIKIYARHGVRGPCYGVAYGDLKPLAKKIGRNQPLALALWNSGVHDARIAATMIAEPGKMTRAQIESWLADCDNYPLTDAVAGVAAQMPGAAEMARAWIQQEREWATSAGWTAIGVRVATGQLTEGEAAELLERIQRTIHTQPNRTRYAMNGVLIGIGGYVEPLRARTLAAARAIGTVHVDHGQTGCQTPDAADYIAKLIAYQARKAATSARGARKKPTKSAAPAPKRAARGARQRAG